MEQQLALLEEKYQLPNGLLNAVMMAESAGDPNAVSPAGAQGLFQFMPETAKAYEIDPFDPNQAAEGAARMYSDLSKQFDGDLQKMLAAYNWGSGNVEKKGLDNMPEETRNYIPKVMGAMPKEEEFDIFDDLGVDLEAAQADEFDVFDDLGIEIEENSSSMMDLADNDYSTKAKGVESAIRRGGAAARAGFQGMSWGAGDEVQAGIAALPVYALKNLFTDDKVTLGQAYDALLNMSRDELDQVRKEYPVQSFVSEIAGAIPSGVGAASKLSKVGKLRKYVRPQNWGDAAKVGALSGAAYGYNSGEGGIRERLEGGAVGGIAGGVSAPVALAMARGGQNVYQSGKKLTDRLVVTPAKNAVNRMAGNQPVTQTAKHLGDYADQASKEITELDPQGYQGALEKIRKAIQKDFPDNYEEVLESWARGDNSLIESYGSRVRTLGQGAAQYKDGKAATQKFFDEAISESPERFQKAITNNISSVDNYFKTVDDVIASGRKKASPLYEKAYQDILPDEDILSIPEVSNALKKAYRQYPSELQNTPKNSIKALDYAKKVLDDDISKAQRAGEGNLARSRTDIKNQLLDVMDDASPSYSQARKSAGDYLQVTKAMDDGKAFMKTDPDLLAKQYKKLSDQEKLAFKTGVAKQLRDKIDNRVEGSNPYNSIFGSKTQKKRLAKILSPQEYQNLEKSLKAEDRLFRMRNEILGGSPTAGKQQAAMEIVGGGAELAQIAQGGIGAVPRSTFVTFLRKSVDGLNDKKANAIARILYETDPSKKLNIISQISKTKNFTPKEKRIIKETYFGVEKQLEQLKKARFYGAVGGASASNQIIEQTKE